MNTPHDERGGFRLSRTGLTLCIIAALTALVLVIDHWAHILEALPRGIVLLPLLLCAGMHLFMHRGHGSHRHRDRPGDRDGKD